MTFRAFLLIALWPVILPGADLPPGFAKEKVAVGISGATGMAVADNGTIFVCEQTGTVRVVKQRKLLDQPFITIDVDDYWERGLIGIELHPGFPQPPFVYVLYVAGKPYPHHRISRFTAKGDLAEPGSELILLKGDNQ